MGDQDPVPAIPYVLDMLRAHIRIKHDGTTSKPSCYVCEFAINLLGTL